MSEKLNDAAQAIADMFNESFGTDQNPTLLPEEEVVEGFGEEVGKAAQVAETPPKAPVAEPVLDDIPTDEEEAALQEEEPQGEEAEEAPKKEEPRASKSSRRDPNRRIRELNAQARQERQAKLQAEKRAEEHERQLRQTQEQLQQMQVWAAQMQQMQVQPRGQEPDDVDQYVDGRVQQQFSQLKAEFDEYREAQRQAVEQAQQAEAARRQEAERLELRNQLERSTTTHVNDQILALVDEEDREGLREEAMESSINMSLIFGEEPEDSTLRLLDFMERFRVARNKSLKRAAASKLRTSQAAPKPPKTKSAAIQTDGLVADQLPDNWDDYYDTVFDAFEDGYAKIPRG